MGASPSISNVRDGSKADACGSIQLSLGAGGPRVVDYMGPEGLAESCTFTMTINTLNAGSGSEESHVDRATRGPTPDNPSLSLTKRLKRAAFFDQREREVSAGVAEPVDADAGLPERMVEEAAMAERAD